MPVGHHKLGQGRRQGIIKCIQIHVLAELDGQIIEDNLTVEPGSEQMIGTASRDIDCASLEVRECAQKLPESDIDIIGFW